ncbi:hypothetical protein CTI12_AA229930 [Artemisia annua]|uniref:Uncharacterized protein n=1 Tax=Artemisia annua TaxID=35608 RepID=A0A2U1NTA9_ARTAN|nr:hypothetical protein CTI12_AA229930 [Artemisia annua]
MRYWIALAQSLLVQTGSLAMGCNASFIVLIPKVIHKLISPNQREYLKGMKILDGSLVANEIVNFAKKEGINLLLFKYDFEIVNFAKKEGINLLLFKYDFEKAFDMDIMA